MASGIYSLAGSSIVIENFVAELGWNGWRYVSENLTTEKIGEHMQSFCF